MDKNKDEQIRALQHQLRTSLRYPLISLDHNPDISEAEYLKACEIARMIRTDILALEGADISPTSESWKAVGGSVIYEAAFQHRMLNPDFETVNHLRLHTSHFTGYRLANIFEDQKIPSWTDAIAGEINPDLAPDAPDWSIPAFLETIKSLPANLVCRPPIKLGEVGWFVKGGLVNRDVMAYQERVTCLYESGVIEELLKRPEIKIIEIGGGYGGLAYHLKKVMPQAQYYICDLPISLLFSAIYLTLANSSEANLVYTGRNKDSFLNGHSEFTFVPNFLFDDLASVKFDLAINTLSFAEMPPSTVKYYVSRLPSMLGESGFLFEQNFDNSHYNLPSFCDPEEEIRANFHHKLFMKPGRWGIARLWNTASDVKSAPRQPPTDVFPTEVQSAEFASPKLVEAGYDGFNLVAYQGKFYGLAVTLGPVDLPYLDSQTLSMYEEHGKCFIGLSIDEVKQLIALNSPSAIHLSSPPNPKREKGLLVGIASVDQNRALIEKLSGYEISLIPFPKLVAMATDLSHTHAKLAPWAQQKFDVIIIPYKGRLYWRDQNLITMTMGWAPKTMIVFPDGRTRIYSGDDVWRLQYTSSYLNRLFQFVPPLAGKRVLDVGCSDGLVCDLMLSENPESIVGIDLLPNVGYNYPDPCVSYFRMDAARMEFEAGSFDLCYSIAVLEHVKDPLTALREIKRVTRPGGYAYVQAGPLYFSPFGHHMFGYFDDYPWIHLRLSKEQIAAHARSKGIDARLRQATGMPIEAYLDGIFSIDHLNGRRLPDYHLDEFTADPDIEILSFTRSYEGENLLTPAIQQELSNYFKDDLISHGFELIFRIK